MYIVNMAQRFQLFNCVMYSVIDEKYTKNPKNSISDFSKYSVIQNKFGACWIQRIGPIYELFQLLSIKTYGFGA